MIKIDTFLKYNSYNKISCVKIYKNILRRRDIVNIKEKTKRLSKKELLEILVMQSKKIDDLEEELQLIKNKLNDKEITIKECGSIAEASLKINKIFEVAQKSADLYLENIKKIEKDQEEIRLKLKKEYDKTKKIKNKK